MYILYKDYHVLENTLFQKQDYFRGKKKRLNVKKKKNLTCSGSGASLPRVLNIHHAVFYTKTGSVLVPEAIVFQKSNKPLKKWLTIFLCERLKCKNVQMYEFPNAS